MPDGYGVKLTITEPISNFKVEYKKNYVDYKGSYLNNMAPGLYLVEEDDLIIVGKGSQEAINLHTLYVYRSNDWFSRVRPIQTGNQVILTGA